MPETKYDRFYVEELVKKYPKLEDLELFFKKIQAITAMDKDQFVEEFLKIVDSTGQKVKKET